jgi:uncharacterized protein YndB with AHSA1/START domain
VINVDHQINAVRREVGRRALEAGEARVVTVSQAYDTDIDDLWEACTTADRIARWMMPVSGDLRLGGRYQLEGNAGGEVLRCDPPQGYDITWEYGDAVSWVEVRLTPDGEGRTRFTLSHIAHVDDHWELYGPGAVGIGWDMTLLGLSLYMGSRAAGTDGDEASPALSEAEFATSPDGVRFTILSGEAWGRADAEGGEDPEVAAAAAKRTIEAYTATPEPAGDGGEAGDGPSAAGVDPE